MGHPQRRRDPPESLHAAQLVACKRRAPYDHDSRSDGQQLLARTRAGAPTLGVGIFRIAYRGSSPLQDPIQDPTPDCLAVRERDVTVIGDIAVIFYIWNGPSITWRRGWYVKTAPLLGLRAIPRRLGQRLGQFWPRACFGRSLRRVAARLTRQAWNCRPAEKRTVQTAEDDPPQTKRLPKSRRTRWRRHRCFHTPWTQC